MVAMDSFARWRMLEEATNRRLRDQIIRWAYAWHEEESKKWYNGNIDRFIQLNTEVPKYYNDQGFKGLCANCFLEKRRKTFKAFDTIFSGNCNKHWVCELCYLSHDCTRNCLLCESDKKKSGQIMNNTFEAYGAGLILEVD